MQEEQLDGIVLAAAGLHRLGRTSLITQYFEPEQMIPAAAQGTLALELREGDKELSGQVNALADIVTEEITCAERLFLKGNRGGLPYADRSICLQIARWKDAIAWNGRKCGWKQYKEM